MTAHSALTAIHVPYNWSYANAAARAAAAGLVPADVGKLARQLDDNTLWMLTDDSPVTWVQIGSAGGTGAPDNAKYVTTEANGTLSAEVVISGLAGNADRAGVGGAGVSHEFDSGASPLTWSAAIDTENVNSTVPGHLYIQDNGAAESFGTYAWAPAGAFDIRMKISVGTEVGTATATPAVGLIVGDSAMNNRCLIELEYPSANDRWVVTAYTYASATLTQRGASILHVPNSMYLRITRDGSNNCSFYFSMDGITWSLIATQSLTFTAGKAGVRMAANAIVTTAAIDWIRSNV